MEKPVNHITIKIMPALGGDCFLISYLEKESVGHILIDFGYASTFHQYLSNALQNIKNKGESIQRAIVTHIDADHIAGAIAFLESNLADIPINDFWHNSYRHIQIGSNSLDVHFDTRQRLAFKAIISKGMPHINDDLRTTIGAEQGSTLGSLILKLGLRWNNDFHAKAVSSDTVEFIQVTENASIFLLSPDNKKLEKLKTMWIKELLKYGLRDANDGSELLDDAFEILLANEMEFLVKGPKVISSRSLDLHELTKVRFVEDDTETNGSSIAFVLSIHGQRLLFLADAHPSLILQRLEKYSPDVPVYFDLIKISHHGSFANTSPALLQKMDSSRYLISTNGGRHSHPDKETIAHIITRPTTATRTLYFNYVTKTSQYFDRIDWMQQYDYRIIYLDEAPHELNIIL